MGSGAVVGVGGGEGATSDCSGEGEVLLSGITGAGDETYKMLGKGDGEGVTTYDGGRELKRFHNGDDEGVVISSGFGLTSGDSVEGTWDAGANCWD
jgi:hypothetical protein